MEHAYCELIITMDKKYNFLVSDYQQFKYMDLVKS